MPIRRPKPRKAAKRTKRAKDYVVISASMYGKRFKGTKIYFEGPRPSGLKTDGTIALGKHILEALTPKFERFRWILTPTTDGITVERGITRVRMSKPTLSRMQRENMERSRDIKTDIVRNFLSLAYPQHFSDAVPSAYVPGTLAGVIKPGIVPRLTGDDKQAVIDFLPAFLASESAAAVSELNAVAQITSLQELAADLEREMQRSHPESWWQGYIKANILLMQQGYIKAIEKMNVAIGDTRFPDFCLITHDNYLDVLEIKKPDTEMLKFDKSRGNYFWDAEVTKAIIQVENYIEQISNKADSVRSHLKDKHGLEIKAVRPRGIILAGDARSFSEHKQRDDFRLLSQGIKSLSVLTYDELLARLNNYVRVLEEYSAKTAPARASETPSAASASTAA